MSGLMVVCFKRWAAKDFASVIKKGDLTRKYRVMTNLPYGVSSSLVFSLFYNNNICNLLFNVDRVLMLDQKQHLQLQF